MAPTDVVPVVVAMGGSDCEMIRGGWLAQPANAWSTVAYLAGATYVLSRHRLVSGWAASRTAVCVGALTLVALGSFLYHGPQPAWGEPVHDLSITLLLVTPIGLRASRRSYAGLAVAGALVATALAPTALVHATLGALVAIGEIRVGRREPRRPEAIVAAIAILAAGILFLVGRTDGALCSPSSLAQPHAGWHIFTAIAAAALLAHDPLRSRVDR